VKKTRLIKHSRHALQMPASRFPGLTCTAAISSSEPLPSSAKSEPKIWHFVFFPVVPFHACSVLKGRKSRPQQTGTQGRRSVRCEHPSITALSVSPTSTRRRQLVGRIHRGSQPPLLPKRKHLACRDILLLSSRRLLGSFCSSRHSWGKKSCILWLFVK